MNMIRKHYDAEYLGYGEKMSSLSNPLPTQQKSKSIFKTLLPLIVFLFFYQLKCLYELDLVNPFWWFQPFFESGWKRIVLILFMYLNGFGIYQYYTNKEKGDVTYTMCTFMSYMVIGMLNCNCQ